MLFSVGSAAQPSGGKLVLTVLDPVPPITTAAVPGTEYLQSEKRQPIE
jgi:hypothetical protein